MAPNGSKWLQMTPNGNKWLRMAPNSSKWLHMATGIDIIIEANLKIINFLDTPLYVHKQSSHPPNVTKNIPLAVNDRLCSNSPRKELFEETTAPFQQALKDSGYSHKFRFRENNQNTKSKKSRKQKCIYFNPPFSSGVKSPIGAQILKLVDSCFQAPHPLHKLFNRHTVKVSYRTTQNMQQIISAHNRKLLNNQTDKQEKACTCRASVCPVQGRCQEEEVIYQATVKHQSPDTGQEIKETYIGLAATSFYKRHQNHKSTFNLRTHETKSELSKHIWYLKDKNIHYELNWKIIDRAKKFTPISKICKLCTF